MLIICSNKVKVPTIRQDKAIQRLIMGDKQKCMVCRPLVVSNGKFVKVQPMNRPYQHVKGCMQEGRF